MDSRPLPGELVASLPQGTDPSRVSHHIPLRGGPDGLLGETHLLVHDGELNVLTRASARDAFRALDLHPVERAMLLAEGWGVQLKLPLRRGAPCALEIPSRDVATILALLAAIRPGPRTSDAAPATASEQPLPAAPTTTSTADLHPRPEPARIHEPAVEGPVAGPPRAADPAPNEPAAAEPPRVAVASRTEPALTEAFARGQPAGRPPKGPIAERETPLRPAPFFRDPMETSERRNLVTDDFDDLDDLFAEQEAATHDSADAAAEAGDEIASADPGNADPARDAASLRERFQRAADEHRQHFVATSAPRPPVPASNALDPALAPRAPSPLRFRFDLDDEIAPAATPPHDQSAERAPSNHTLAEFFDAHVQLPAEDPPRRAVQPQAAAPLLPSSAEPPKPLWCEAVEAKPQTAPLPIAAEPAKPLEPESDAALARTSLARLAAERVAARHHSPQPSAQEAPPERPRGPASRAITEPIPTATDDATLPPGIEPPPEASPRPNRRLLSPRLVAASSQAATAAATSASAAASAASHAFGKARLAAARYFARRRTQQSGRRRNRRRNGAHLSPRVIALATAALLLPILLYLVIPTGEPQPEPAEADASPPARAHDQPITAELPSDALPPHVEDLAAAAAPQPPDRAREPGPDVSPTPPVNRDFLGVATLTTTSPRPEDLALRECRALAPRGLRVRVKVEINEPTGGIVEVYVGDSSIERELRSCIARQFKKASFEPKRRGGKLIKPRLTLQF